jgi:hypothetical protein
MTDKNLMLAILAMDAYYNRIAGWQIGNATVTQVADQLNGFAALAYSYGGETVISYRGTDGVTDLDDWIGGLGAVPPQAGLAAEFYRSISGGSIYNGNITLTGHSLGGGEVTVH